MLYLVIVFIFIYRFQMAVTMGRRRFPSIKVSNKKEGRKEAAEMALKTLIGEGNFYIEQETAVRVGCQLKSMFS